MNLLGLTVAGHKTWIAHGSYKREYRDLGQLPMSTGDLGGGLVQRASFTTTLKTRKTEPGPM
jgi:hypothetical protein